MDSEEVKTTDKVTIFDDYIYACRYPRITGIQLNTYSNYLGDEISETDNAKRHREMSKSIAGYVEVENAIMATPFWMPIPERFIGTLPSISK